MFAANLEYVTYYDTYYMYQMFWSKIEISVTFLDPTGEARASDLVFNLSTRSGLILFFRLRQ